MKKAITLDVTQPLALLAACPAYNPSPLTTCQLDGRSILIKDETKRMGLGAFKALGGVYAVAKLIEARLGYPIAPQELLDAPCRAIASDMVFVCASAGNHGLAVATGARVFGARARIHLAQTVPEDFAIRLRDKGAEVVRSGNNYEASVNAAVSDCEATGAIHLADGSWPGYTEPPRLVMEGYTVIAEEMRRSFARNGNWPSHVYLQAGVGGLAAAIAHMIRSTWAEQPKIIVVEPVAAPCLRESAIAGRIVTVEGPTSTMGRLDCKTPSMLALNILMSCADEWVTVSDEQASEAVETARATGFLTTPSGAAGLSACLRQDAARPLIILSEGSVSDA
ncbi:diaminopropionate ammonia-lyase [Ruegeria sp. ANG-S4]|uniref:pyridoxal-phosphate dependent enzyme n=1 Tax=Ruegeria sp. ANG-S4 TaxID=1577904 RepID=UPI00057F9516|nr:pyridoxal-phosphate dependent enzyme [Ruegeria sp. ANG-S4]KIC46819.1 diaminopropionate ammonia-lyase [Ruegeria sp. ANG-S4]